MITLQLDRGVFLRDYWQQRPLLIKQGLPGFSDLLEAELLAGLAQEAEVDARIIEHRQGQWQVSHGPFDDYEALGEQDWTLLVQSVNEWLPEIQALLAPFRFLPDWRLDDVMISFATPNGSVGPHLDQYDVFIIQGEGQRHWRVGERLNEAKEYRPHADLKQLSEPFDAVIDEMLEAGDILYIPAGCPHHGVAITPSLNYSIGFRAPNTAELTSLLADMMLAAEQRYPRYQDPHASDYGAPYQVSQAQLQQVQHFLLEQLARPDLDHLLLQVMSQSKRPLPQPDYAVTWADLMDCMAQHMLLCRTAGARLLLGPVADTLYANGDPISLTAQTRPFAEALAAQWGEVPLTDYQQALQSAENQRLLCLLLNSGLYHLIDEQDADSA